MGLTNEEEDQITDDKEEDVQITVDEDPDDTDEEFPLDDEQVDDQPQPVQALPQVPADVMEDLRSDLDQREAMYLMHRNAARNKFDQIVAMIASLPELQQHENVTVDESDNEDPIPIDDNVPADPQIEVPAQIINNPQIVVNNPALPQVPPEVDESDNDSEHK